MAKLAKLPVGIQTFSEVREEKYVYIDKTPLVHRLVEEGKYYFLSRPRRFGKSMLISTLQSLFEGRKELFAGLYIHDKWDWQTKYPVIKISFGGVARDLADMKQDVAAILRDNQERLGIQCPEGDDAGSCFKYLIKHAAKKYGQKVVILVDEYDKLIVDNIDQVEVAKQGREVLKDLYSTIKDSDEYVKFALLTGVSKFSKVSVFSGLNNLEDISLNPDYATVCGYTQHDLETTFAGHLQGVDMDKVREWYNGYNFLGEPVYNPFDILLFIKNGHIFKGYWFATGTPTLLIKLIEQNNYYIPTLGSLKVPETLIDSYDVENIKLEPILFQSGYLSIKEVKHVSYGIEYILGFPNKEVAISFNDHVACALTQDNNAVVKGQLYESLKQGDPGQLNKVLVSVFAGIAHTNYTKNKINAYEGYYASIVYAYLASLGLELIPEDVTNKGRIDLTLKFDDKIYIIEFKVDGSGKALQQIKDMNYAQKYQSRKQVYLIGINFSSAEKNISGFEWEMG
jgi:hypothetical protein